MSTDDQTIKLPDDANGFLRLIYEMILKLDARLDIMEGRQDKMDGRLEKMDGRLEKMDGRLSTIEETLDKRLYDTRPIWESVQAQLKQISTDVRGLKLNVRALNDNMLVIQSTQRGIEDRLSSLEEKTP